MQKYRRCTDTRVGIIEMLAKVMDGDVPSKCYTPANRTQRHVPLKAVPGADQS